jgi:O-antigen/teichoic acid export membrane protein
MNSKKNFLNLIANFFSMFLYILISLYLTPIIISNSGVEAYGFVTLARNLTFYLTIFTVSINSLAGRFVSVYYYRDQKDKAKIIFDNVIISNIILFIVFSLFFILFITNLEFLFKIPIILLSEIKILFLFVYIGFLIETISSIYQISLFLTENLHLVAFRNIEGSIIRAVLIYFIYLGPNKQIFFIAFAAVISYLYQLVWNLYYQRKFLPQFSNNGISFNFTLFMPLIKSGLWNSVNQFSFILRNSFDLLVVNIVLGTYTLGILGLSKTIPVIFINLLISIYSVYTPTITKLFALDDFKNLFIYIYRTNNFISLFVNTFIAGFVTIGFSFYKLWIPTQDFELVYYVSLIVLIDFIFCGSISVGIQSILIATNMIKLDSIINLIQGFTNILIYFLLANFDDVNIIHFSLVAPLTTLIKNFFFTFFIASKAIKQKTLTFVFLSLKNFIFTFFITSLFYFITLLFTISSWSILILLSIFLGFFGILINSFLYFDLREIRDLFRTLKRTLIIYFKKV